MSKLIARGLVPSLVSAIALAACNTATPDGASGETTSDLTAEQCLYFDVDGTTQICHATGSITHPFVILKVSGRACVSAHSSHPSDYIAVDDPTCQGLGCLPTDAPCDSTAPCCDGLTCSNGTCAPAASCGGFGYADASASGCACPTGELTCYSPTPGVGILCVAPDTGAAQFAFTAGATCGPFQCQQYGWTVAASCTCTDNGQHPVACTDQHGATDCNWRQGTGYDGVFGNVNLLVCQ